MSDGSSRAAGICETVAGIINTRGKTHGDALVNLQDIANRWQSLFPETKMDIDIGTVCRAMIEVKMSRAVCGNDKEIDHALDILGYSAIWAAWLEIQNDGVKNDKK